MARAGSLPVEIPHQARSGFETFARLGFAAKGIVYVLVGVLALMAALGEGGQTTDSKGAVAWLAGQPFGEFALWLVGIGLLGYAAWRFIAAFRDSQHKGSDAKGLGKRAVYALIGIAYTSTAIYALRIASGDPAGSGGSQSQAQSWTARLLEAPLGVVLVIAIGIGIFAAGVMQMHKGWSEKFTKDLRSLPPNSNHVITAGKWGYIARGIVFAIIGSFVIAAALDHDPQKVRGLEGALDTIASQPWGQFLLAFIAAGLACYGAWSLIESRYRRV